MRKSVLALMVVPFLAMAGAPAVAHSVKDLPKGVVKSSGVVPRMGEHWADPKDRKMGGPTFGVVNGKFVFFEIEVPHYAVHMYTVPHAVHMKYRPKKRRK